MEEKNKEYFCKGCDVKLVCNFDAPIDPNHVYGVCSECGCNYIIIIDTKELISDYVCGIHLCECNNIKCDGNCEFKIEGYDINLINELKHRDVLYAFTTFLEYVNNLRNEIKKLKNFE